MTRIAVITGGSRGLGRNAALKLARGGCGIVPTYQARHEDADAVVSDIAAIGGRAVALQLDTGDIARFAGFRNELVAALRSNWARDTFDYLINNAGYGIHAPIAETTEEQFDSLMNVHLKGVFFLTQTLLPLMEDDGRIMNLSTGLARFPLPGYAAYAAMKGAVEVLTAIWRRNSDRGALPSIPSRPARSRQTSRRCRTRRRRDQPDGGCDDRDGPRRAV